MADIIELFILTPWFYVMPRTTDFEKIIDDLENNNPILKILNLDEQDLNQDEVTRLANALKRNTTLTSLSLFSNNIGNDGAIVIAKMLEQNKRLNSLKLESNNIRSKGTVALAAALEINSTLRVLGLSCNIIGDDGAAALAAAIEKNSTLHELHLMLSSINDSGIAAMATALKHNSTLTVLNIIGNVNICDPGATALAIALQNNNTLHSLWVVNCGISQEGIGVFARALEKNTTITFPSLSVSTTNQNQTLRSLLNRNSKLAMEKESNLIKAAIVIINGLQESNHFAKIPFDILKQIFIRAASDRETAAEVLRDVSTHMLKRKASPSSEKWALTKWLVPSNESRGRLKLGPILKDNPIFTPLKQIQCEDEKKENKSFDLPPCEIRQSP